MNLVIHQVPVPELETEHRPTGNTSAPAGRNLHPSKFLEGREGPHKQGYLKAVT